MKNTMVVVTDLAGFKAYRLDNGELNRAPRLELLEEYSNAEAHGRIVDQVTDLAGRFPRRTGRPQEAGAMSDGERHNIELEQRKRLVRRLGRRLSALMRSHEIEHCFLAASREINNPLMDELDPAVRAKVDKNVAADLTKIDKANLLRYFRPPVQASGAGLRPFA